VKQPRVVSISRKRDEQILRWLDMRARGKTLEDIAHHEGIAETSRISDPTSWVRDADIAESGEPIAKVRAAYRWRQKSGKKE
jgi:hypothetical protein